MIDQVTVIIITYNHRPFIESCLSSVFGDELVKEVIVFDNSSSDDTASCVKRKYPSAIVVESPKNLGFGAAVNAAAQQAKGEILVVLNPDTIVEKEAIYRLVEPILNGTANVTTPKIVLLSDPTRLNTCGLVTTYFGMAFTRGLEESAIGYTIQEKVSGFSGACFAIKKKEFFETGGFDENIFLYMEDTEYSWRLHSLGKTIWYIPDAIIHHYYTLTVTPEKIRFLEKGRYYILKKYLTPREITLMVPALFIAEILSFSYAIRHGIRGLQAKIYAFRDVQSLNSSSLHKVKNNPPLKFCGILPHLDKIIPENQLSFSPIDLIIRKLCNKVFLWNYRLFYR